ncbi:MAG: transcriptional repressor NrdR [Acidimicrobiia bacterium]|nr:transcriptional repressor NrdR [Acidimicrobiia bacterium]
MASIAEERRRHPAAGSERRLRLVRGRADLSLGSSVGDVRCPVCTGLDDKVVDSRTADDGLAIRRRRECLACGHRFTTFERLETAPLMVVKRSGDRVPFDRAKIEAGLALAGKGRPISQLQLGDVAAAVEEEMRLVGGDITSERIGLTVLEKLRDLDQVAYVRFASVYKGFDDPADFEAEIVLLAKATEPKRHSGGDPADGPG